MEKKDYGHFYIYAICDPRTNRVFYVGRTKNLKVRIKKHFKEAELFDDSDHNNEAYMRLLGLKRKDKSVRHPNIEKARLIKSIFADSLEPIVKTLDEWYAVSLSDANRLEEAWIAHMSMLGEPLTNQITSRRMESWWYSPTSKMWKPGMATSPMEYIKMLKDGTIASRTKTNHYTRRYKRYKKRYSQKSKNASNPKNSNRKRSKK